MKSLTLSAPSRFSAEIFFFFWKFFLEKILNFFFHIGVKKKLKDQVRNEIFRQMSLTLTLPLDVPVRPMDAKGLTLTLTLFWWRL